MKFYGEVQGGKRNEWLNFGGNSDHYADCPIRYPAIMQQIISRFDENFRRAL